MFVPHVVVAPVHAVTVTLLLWFYVGLGPSCLPGMGLLLLQMPLQYLVGRLYAKLRWVVVYGLHKGRSPKQGARPPTRLPALSGSRVPGILTSV